MIKKRFFIFIIFFVFLAVPMKAMCANNAQAFLDGIKYYKAGEFQKAIDEFEKIAGSGVKNGELYYNLGNAYLKKGRLGKAILWYERALELIPHDPDLKFNYEYATSLVKDKKPDEDISVFPVLFFWKFFLDKKTIRILALVFSLFFWILMGVNTLGRKKPFNITVFMVLILSLIFTATAFYNYYEKCCIKQGVILEDEVKVRSGFDDHSTELFVLHAGTKVRVEEEKHDFYKIRFSDKMIGWIKKDKMEIIQLWDEIKKLS